MTRDELIAALEAAPGPSRELDVAIWNAVREWPRENDAEWQAATRAYAPNFTGSLDRAVSLYKRLPALISSDARLVCIEALRQWPAERSAPDGQA